MMKRYLLVVCLLSASGTSLWALWRMPLQTVDSQGDAGKYTSLRLDAAGNPHIAYHDETNGTLKYARWDGVSWVIETIDAGGQFASLVLDSSGAPHISYYGGGVVRYARKSGEAWTAQGVDVSGPVTHSATSLALGADGYPHIAYVKLTNTVIGTDYEHKYARWTGTAWSTSTISARASVEASLSLALDRSDRPHVVFYDNSEYALKYARWNGAAWDVQTVDPARDTGLYPFIVLDSSGYPHCAYHDGVNGDLKYARWNGAAWDIRVIDAPGWVGQYPSLTFDDAGNPRLSYYGEYALKYAEWKEGAWVIKTVDSAAGLGGLRGQYSSLAVDASGAAHISYYDGVGRDLKYAKIHWTMDIDTAKNDIAVYHPVFRASEDEKAIIKFNLVAPARVDLSVYDYAGSKIATLVQAVFEAGLHSAEWNGKNESGDTVPSGTYLLLFRDNRSTIMKKVVVIR